MLSIICYKYNLPPRLTQIIKADDKQYLVKDKNEEIMNYGDLYKKIQSEMGYTNIVLFVQDVIDADIIYDKLSMNTFLPLVIKTMIKEFLLPAKKTIIHIANNMPNHRVYCRINNTPESIYHIDGMCYFCKNAEIYVATTSKTLEQIWPLQLNSRTPIKNDRFNLERIFKIALQNSSIWNNMHNPISRIKEQPLLVQEAYKIIFPHYHCDIHTSSIYHILLSSEQEIIGNIYEKGIRVHIDKKSWFDDNDDPLNFVDTCDTNDDKIIYNVVDLISTTLLRVVESELHLLLPMIEFALANPDLLMDRQLISSKKYISRMIDINHDDYIMFTTFGKS